MNGVVGINHTPGTGIEDNFEDIVLLHLVQQQFEFAA